jgi:FtsP/CotA-like multicopper oxidase with cupredoxin domain
VEDTLTKRLIFSIFGIVFLIGGSTFFLKYPKFFRNGAHTRSPSSANPALCSRFAPGSLVSQPEDLFSQDGVLKLTLSYRTSLDPSGNSLFCYGLPDGNQSPTLHLKPGDRLVLTLKNETPAPSSADSMAMQIPQAQICGDSEMNGASTNLHFHGANIAPTCHQDDVLHTLVNSGSSFTYDIRFPKDEPPGLYWYHPHIHGISESAVLGGASGAIVIEGLENAQPDVAGLPQQILILRDNLVPGNPTPGGVIPSWDLSLNFVPIPYPHYPPAIISMKNGEKQLWRVLNAAADTILDLALQYDGTAQPLGVVALDGVPTGSQDGKAELVTKSHVLLGPGARVEFIVTGPEPSVKSALLTTLDVNTGPDGDNDPARPIAAIDVTKPPPAPLIVVPESSKESIQIRFPDLKKETPLRTRQINFSEVLQKPSDPNSPTTFYIAEENVTPKAFQMNDAPSITVTQGTTEDWVISNRSQENHVFHIHQIHFLLLERDGKPVPSEQQQLLDTVQIPYWSGSGPYPSVKVRMDFRGPDVGEFVYHCHILEHEDGGMMAILQVVRPTPAPSFRHF